MYMINVTTYFQYGEYDENESINVTIGFYDDLETAKDAAREFLKEKYDIEEEFERYEPEFGMPFDKISFYHHSQKLHEDIYIVLKIAEYDCNTLFNTAALFY